MIRLFALLLFFVFISAFVFGQITSTSTEPKRDFLSISPQLDKKKIHLINYSIAGGYIGSMSWLYTQWYKNYPTSAFHFFNDDSEWMQMDKFAHCWDAYNIARPLQSIYTWAGYDNKRATLYAAGVAYLYQTTVEVFDGFSQEWGFSPGDIMANTTGVALFTSQQLLWKEQRFILKFSFHTTQFSKYRPDLLGSTVPEKILKDYNGLTYWLTVCPGKFMKPGNHFPKWLNLAGGFGAEGMTGGKVNPTEVDGKPIPFFERRRQYYLSLDINLSAIETHSRFFNSLFSLINIIHLPAPAIEFSDKAKPKFHGLYF